MNKTVNLRALLLSGVSCVLMAGITTPASAQTAPAASPGQDQATNLDEIVVTAQKREQRLNDVGITITAIGAQQLQERQIVTLSDLAQSVPGLTFTTSASNTPVYTLRGVGFNDTTLGAYPDVSVYLDEAPLPFPVMTKLSAFDLERVEVLKGPQGTLFGNNATGGAINYIAAKPTDDFQAGASLGYGRFNTITADGYISGPLTETLNARLAGRVVTSDDWQRSYTTGETTGETENYAARLLLDWKPTDRLRVNLDVNGWSEQGEPQAFQVIGTRAAIPGVPNPVTGVPLAPRDNRAADFTSSIDPSLDNTLFQAVARIDFDLTEDLTITSLTSYTDYQQDMAFDGDGVVQRNADFRSFAGGIKSYSQELRIANSGSDVFRWVAGLNYSNDKAEDTSILDYRDSTIFTGAGIFMSGFRANQEMENFAGFANGEYDVGRFTFKAGVRYTESDRKANSCFFGVPTENSNVGFIGLYTFFANTLRGANGLAPIATVNSLGCLTIDTTGLNGNAPTYLPGEFVGELNEDNVSWRVGTDFKLNDDILIYGNVSKGFKSGSFPSVAASTTEQSQPVTQESLISYEAGIKATFFEGKVQANAAAFFYDYQDRQLRSKLIDPNFGVLDVLVNVPKTEVTGLELDLTARPVDGLRLYTNFTYLDSEIKEFTGVSAEGVTGNFAGAPIPYTPKYQVNTGVDYEWTVADTMTMYAGADLTYRSDTTAIIGGSSIYDIDAYTLLDLRVGIRGPEDRWTLQVYGKNVTDEYYWDNVTSFFDTITRTTGRPATYGAVLSFKY